MKAKIRNLLLAATLVLGLASCQSNDSGEDPEPDPKPGEKTHGTVSKVDITAKDYGATYEDHYVYSMEYDKNNNIAQITLNGDEGVASCSYLRGGDNKLTVTVTDNFYQTKFVNELVSNLDAKGLIVTGQYSQSYADNDPWVQAIQCRYSDKDELIGFNSPNYDNIYKWTDGNISESDYILPDGGRVVGKQYSSEHKNMTNWNFSDLVFITGVSGSIFINDIFGFMNLRSAGYFGVRDKYLPAKVEWVDDRMDPSITEYTYEFNADGWPQTIIAKCNNKYETTLTMKITYKK